MKKIPLLIFFGFFTSFLAQRASRQNAPSVTLTAESFGNNPQLINRYNALPRMSQLLFFDQFKKLPKPFPTYLVMVVVLFIISVFSTGTFIGMVAISNQNMVWLLTKLWIFFIVSFFFMYWPYAHSFGLSWLRCFMGIFSLSSFGFPLLVDMFVLDSFFLNFRVRQVGKLLDKLEVKPLP